MKKIFLLSGLGADQRVFKFLEFNGKPTQAIEWIKPKRGESILTYAKKLTEQIDEENPVLLGVSFGGIMAIELAKIIPVEKVILISSARNKQQVPAVNRAIGRLQLTRLLPASYLKKPNRTLHWLFGIESPEEQELLKGILYDTDTDFLQWGMARIAQWDNMQEVNGLVQIHGKEDRIFPHKSGDHLVDDGGHFMIVNRAATISQLLRPLLTS